MRKAWGSKARFVGILEGEVGQLTDDGLYLGFTVATDGARRTVTLLKADAQITITETQVIITEVTPDA